MCERYIQWSERFTGLCTKWHNFLAVTVLELNQYLHTHVSVSTLFSPIQGLLPTDCIQSLVLWLKIQDLGTELDCTFTQVTFCYSVYFKNGILYLWEKSNKVALLRTSISSPDWFYYICGSSGALVVWASATEQGQRESCSCLPGFCTTQHLCQEWKSTHMKDCYASPSLPMSFCLLPSAFNSVKLLKPNQVFLLSFIRHFPSTYSMPTSFTRDPHTNSFWQKKREIHTDELGI